MHMSKAFLVSVIMLLTGRLIGSAHENHELLPDSIHISDSLRFNILSSSDAERIIVKSLPGMDEARRKKLVSAMLAFPFPFGFMGAHRVMLGSKPWIPVVYVATFGGCFGLLPMIDFIAILCSKDIEQYENNPKVFMWLK
jgi:TM2 domain-containing membrane protein YozV